jgi:DNA-binding GntR family transcriptional regulator
MDPLSHRNLVPSVVERIEGLLFSAKLLPGERINESHLAQSLGVSRGPIREALRLLEKHGLVQTQANKGAYVCRLSSEDMADLYDIRATLEGLIGERAATRIDATAIAGLHHDLDQMEQASARDDSVSYYGINLHFHERILAATGSSHLAGIYEGIAKKIALNRIANPAPREVVASSLQEHRHIVEALATGDSRLAGEAMRAHCRAGYHRILQQARDDGEQHASEHRA